MSTAAMKSDPAKMDMLTVKITPRGAMRSGVADALSMRGLVRAMRVLRNDQISVQDRAINKVINISGSAAEALENAKSNE